VDTGRAGSGSGSGAGDDCRRAPFYELFGDDPTALGARDHVAGYLNLCFVRSVLEEHLDRTLRERAGVTVAQHEVLYRLSLAPAGRVRMAELAELILTSKSGTSRLIDRMARAGLVERTSSPSDRRLVFAELTPAGCDTLRRSAPVFVGGVTEVFGRHLDDEDHRRLQQLLHTLLAAHGAWDVRRCEPPPTPLNTEPEDAS